MTRRKAVYYLGQPERIGEACDQINRVRNLHPASDFDLTVVWPVLRPVANAAVMEMLCRGLQTVQVRSREELLAVYQRIQQQDPAFLFIEDDRHHPEEEYARVYGHERTFFCSLTAEEQARGQQLRDRLGIPATARLVTLHVREGGYVPNLSYHNYRDANIKNYYPAIRYLVNRGYWVVRLGDKSMQKLEDLPPQVIDAPFHPAYEPFFEPYFIASSRFYLGVPSGPMSLARVFDIPSLLTNYPFLPIAPETHRDILVYKKYFSTQLGRLLSYEEAITSPVVDYNLTQLFEQSGIQLIENSPAE
ncbi:MAG: TIGR04372 family glycosyltransferase, partial [Magnetococcales bacterium]|nr:TIGR04372 family glycosyltransferase [Magnetococcales bacterium]